MKRKLEDCLKSRGDVRSQWQRAQKGAKQKKRLDLGKVEPETKKLRQV